MGFIYNARVMRASKQHEEGFTPASSILSRGASSSTSSGLDLHAFFNAKHPDGNLQDGLRADSLPLIQGKWKEGALRPQPSPFEDLSLNNTCNLMQEGIEFARAQHWAPAIPLLEQGLAALTNTSDSNQACPHTDVDASMYALARSYAEMGQFDMARRWTDKLYEVRRIIIAEPAYHLCRRLREAGHNALAYYYCLLAKRSNKAQQALGHGAIAVEPAVYDYLLDYEDSILWSYVGDIHERHSRLYGLDLSMQLLENPRLPRVLRESVQSNLQYYTVPIRGSTYVLRAEKAVEEEWRYSTPTFVDDDTMLIRVVNYYVAEDGSYHVSPKAGDRVDTRLVIASTEEELKVELSPAFQHHAAARALNHPDAYILGLEDTRVVVDRTHSGIIYTLSASQQYSVDGRTMNQVLAVLDLDHKTHTIQGIITGPYPDRHDKNWVFAGGIDNIVYGWYPSIEIGALDPAAEEAALRIHTTIASPSSFEGMRGSTNGVLYEQEWWFVTHSVVYRPGRMRKYLHRLVVLDKELGKVVRYSLPFTFEEPADIEYCLGLRVDESGLTFGYSVRDRSSRTRHAKWMHIGTLFE